jgi:hypothetical protein
MQDEFLYYRMLVSLFELDVHTSRNGDHTAELANKG